MATRRKRFQKASRGGYSPDSSRGTFADRYRTFPSGRKILSCSDAEGRWQTKSEGKGNSEQLEARNS